MDFHPAKGNSRTAESSTRYSSLESASEVYSGLLSRMCMHSFNCISTGDMLKVCDSTLEDQGLHADVKHVYESTQNIYTKRLSAGTVNIMLFVRHNKYVERHMMRHIMCDCE